MIAEQEVLSEKKFKDRGTYTEIRNIISRGSFTPFLGAGASSLRPQQLILCDTPWREIVRAIRSLMGRLEGERYKDERGYLRSFAEQRLRLGADELTAGLAIPGDELPLEAGQARAAWPGEALLELQGAVVTLTTRLGTVFGTTLASSQYSVISIADCALYPSQESVDKACLSQLLFDAVEAARKLSASENVRDKAGPLLAARTRVAAPILEAEAIFNKLLQLTYEMVTTAMWESQTWSQWRAQEGINANPPVFERDAPFDKLVIRLDHLAWLSDLLWYTLRFWSPHHPTTSELAFELALIAYLTPTRKAELAQAAEALLDDRVMVKRLQSMFGYYEEASIPSRFHLYVAAALHETFSHYIVAQEEFRRGDSDDSDPGLPIAFTTNYDRALERALEDLNVTYHVVYPVMSGRSENSGVKWRLGTRYKKGMIAHTFPETLDCSNDQVFNRHTREFEGPIIVKLHGSPLDPLDKNEAHWVVLSESGYLAAIIQRREALPTWIEEQLSASSGSPRSLWFLGYSVADWNIRVRLYEHLCHAMVAEKKARPTKGVLDRRLDSFRRAIFNRLQIQLYVGDLMDLPTAIHSALLDLRVRGQLRSEEVKSFIDRNRAR